MTAEDERPWSPACGSSYVPRGPFDTGTACRRCGEDVSWHASSGRTSARAQAEDMRTRFLGGRENSAELIRAAMAVDAAAGRPDRRTSAGWGWGTWGTEIHALGEARNRSAPEQD